MTYVAELKSQLEGEVKKVIVGQEEAVRLMYLALVCEGHVLLEGVPGVAKTTLARTVARALGLDFGRVQFTPDLMPSDIVGTQIFNFQEGQFRFIAGPIFTNLLLADEINRSPAKTQAALLEAMQERQVSVEGETRDLPKPFLVIATQNPVEYEGTYRLPEAQLDRFLFHIELLYPEEHEELEMLSVHRGDSAGLSTLLDQVQEVATPEDLARAKSEVMKVHVDEPVARYLLELVRHTRNHPHLQLGGSPRCSLLLQVAARAAAALEGRDYVIPDDVKSLLPPVLSHRVILTAAAEVEGLDTARVLREICDAVSVPR